MQVIVLATEEQKAHFSENNSGIIWVNELSAFAAYASADAFIDLQFVPTEERIAVLSALLPKPVIVNSVAHTLSDTHPDFIRINAWNTFFSLHVWEASCQQERIQQKADAVFQFLGKRAEWLPDTPGFVTARVVSMIVNEAYLALEEGVSTKEEINTAMKLGTAYPYGPFEWAEKIVVQNIVQLLQMLARQNSRYTPARLLVQEIERSV
jgi:3-hydroxybutyryl-CoA dehydrogenase